MKYLFIALSMLSATYANSETKYCTKYAHPTERDSIIHVEREQYFTDNNFLFLCKDLYLDGFLSYDQYYLRKPFIIKYNKETLSLNGTEFPTEYNTKYAASIKLVMKRLNVPDAHQDIRIHTDRIKRDIEVKEQNNLLVTQEKEVYRGCRPALYYVTVTSNYTPKSKLPVDIFTTDSVLLQTIATDKYVSKPCNVKVRCNNNTCWINEKALTDVESKKYSAMIQNITGIKPSSEKDFTGVSYRSEDFERFSVKL